MKSKSKPPVSMPIRVLPGAVGIVIELRGRATIKVTVQRPVREQSEEVPSSSTARGKR